MKKWVICLLLCIMHEINSIICMEAGRMWLGVLNIIGSVIWLVNTYVLKYDEE